MASTWPEVAPDLGRQIVEEYARFKNAIVANRTHTRRAGQSVVVEETFALPQRLQDGWLVREKIRGGSVSHPVTWVDEDPDTLDRISVEQEMERDGQVGRRASLIYREFSEAVSPVSRLLRLVVERTEEFVAITAAGESAGEKILKVDSETFRILEQNGVKPQT